MLNFWELSRYHSFYTVLHSHQQRKKIPIFLHPYQYLFLSLSLSLFFLMLSFSFPYVILMDDNWHPIVKLICIFLMISDVGHLFMYLLAMNICISFWRSGFSNSLSVFNCFFFFLSLLSCKSYIFWMIIHYQIYGL